jgi:hypothetical protein
MNKRNCFEDIRRNSRTVILGYQMIIWINRCDLIIIKAVTYIIWTALISLMWAHLGLNQGPPDYESGALTN